MFSAINNGQDSTNFILSSNYILKDIIGQTKGLLLINKFGTNIDKKKS
jgi:hypothetical protein